VEGVAGTGKTNYAAGMALKLLREGKIKKILVSRPMITCGKELGFFPGDMNEKTFPYMIPVIDAFEYYISKQEIDKYLATTFD
jgi:phosphate starvation-inducible PhoH-like protein